MRIMGIDPGSRITGVGVIDDVDNKITPVFFESLKLGADDLPLRIAKLNDLLGEAVALHKPDVVAIEAVFMAKNAKSALTLGHARGAAMAIVLAKGVQVAEYSAKQIKSAVAGSGAADKAQVQYMVQRILNIKEAIAEDAADGLACAICHSVHAKTASRLLKGRISGGA